jgi:hypothetical protein
VIENWQYRTVRWEGVIRDLQLWVSTTGVALTETVSEIDDQSLEAWIDLYWLPLGAGGTCVRFNGRLYERVLALRERRPPSDLYHSALQLRLDNITYAIEMGPVWNVADPDRGAICQGPVGAPWLGRFRAFQYEVRWPGGYIPDITEAVDSPRRVSEARSQVAAVLAALRRVPPLTWGRDELRTGDMWNSNSIVSWALACTEHNMATLRPPAHGRAPGWNAGMVLAAREQPIRAQAAAH